MSDHVTEAEAKRIAEEAAERAVRKVYAILGTNLDDPVQVRALQQDLVFARQNRVTSQRIGFGVKMLIAVTLVSGVLSLLWLAIANLMHFDPTTLKR